MGVLNNGNNMKILGVCNSTRYKAIHEFSRRTFITLDESRSSEKWRIRSSILWPLNVCVISICMYIYIHTTSSWYNFMKLYFFYLGIKYNFIYIIYLHYNALVRNRFRLNYRLCMTTHQWIINSKIYLLILHN